MLLENHAGRHSEVYHERINEMLWKAYDNVVGKGKEAAEKAIYILLNNIENGIADGTLKPYVNKDVYIP